MLSLTLDDKYPLNTNFLKNITSLTFDGKNFYTCHKDKPIVYKLCTCFNLSGSFLLDSCYKSISYDCKDDIFWAIGYEKDMFIYKLDRSFDLIESIPLNNLFSKNFLSIYYDVYTDHIILYTNEVIITFSKDIEVINIQKNPREIQSCYGCSLNNRKVVNYNKSKVSLINMYNNDNEFIDAQYIPENFISNGICPAYEYSDLPCLFLLVTNNYGETFVLKYKYT